MFSAKLKVEECKPASTSVVNDEGEALVKEGRREYRCEAVWEPGMEKRYGSQWERVRTRADERG